MASVYGRWHRGGRFDCVGVMTGSRFYLARLAYADTSANHREAITPGPVPMSPQQIVAVVARLLAVWIVIHLPGQVSEIVYLGGHDTDRSMRAFAVGGFAVELFVSLALWFFPLTIARKLLRSSSEERPPPSSSDVWLGMGCALIGLWLLATSLPALVINFFILGSAIGSSGDISSSVRQNVFSI